MFHFKKTILLKKSSFFLILYFITYCSVQSDEFSQKKSQYPFWNLHFIGFIVQKPDSANPPSHQTKLIPAEKEIMLRALDTLKFIINSSEFADTVLNTQFISSQDMSGPNGTIKTGEEFNNDRLLETIRKNTLSLAIQKSTIKYPILATGTVGEPLYVLSNHHIANKYAYMIMLQNDVRWDQYQDYQNTGKMASIIFHEVLHNMGFIHLPNTNLQNNSIKKKDCIYKLQEIVLDIYTKISVSPDKMKILDDFRPFYELKEKKWLRFDTHINYYLQETMQNSQKNAHYVEYMMDIYGNCAIFSSSH